MHRRDAGLLRAAQTGDRRARDRLVAEHLRVVRAVASHYRDIGLPYDDLVQEGSLGLLEAIEQYEPQRGTDFETYARFRVRRAIRNALTEKSRLIRLPKQIVERRRALDHAEARLTAADGHAPTPAELAKVTGLTPAAVDQIRRAATAPVSLDHAVLADGSPLETVIPDRAALDPELEAERHEQAEKLDAAVAALPSRQREIVSRHYGLGVDPEEIADVAADLHVSQQRARTIERDALYALRDDLER